MKKIKNSKGFTLMEMLIVVAIIAVLVAIAIPTFTTSLNKARVATDEANIRSGYASLMAEILTNQYDVEAGKAEDVKEQTFYLQKDGTVAAGKEAGKVYVCVGDSAKVKNNIEIAGRSVTSWKPGQVIEYTYTPAGNTPAGGTTASDAIAITIKPVDNK